jgi:hypothetical protein
MSNAIVSFRMEEALGIALRAWAKAENRTLSNFMTNLINREMQRRDGKVVSLESLDIHLDQIEESIEQLKVQKKKRKVEDEGPSVFEMDFESHPEVVSEEAWKAWIVHLRKLGTRVDFYLACNHFNLLVELYEEGNWDCDKLIEHLIKHNARSIYLPSEWRFQK